MKKINQLLLSIILVLCVIAVGYSLYLLSFYHNAKLAENEKLWDNCQKLAMDDYNKALLELNAKYKNPTGKIYLSELDRLNEIVKHQQNLCEKKFPIKRNW